MSLVLNGSGTITGLSAGGLPDSSVTTAELADAAVTQAKLGTNVAGTGPAFSAYGNFDTQGISNVTFTKVAFNTESFDTNSNYDTANYRFTPTVAGRYQINAMVGLFASSAAATVMIASIYKNGTEFRRVDNRVGSSMSSMGIALSEIINMNGSTDYVEILVYVSVPSGTISVLGSIYSTFSGSLARAA